jgi:hypothetical protein
VPGDDHRAVLQVQHLAQPGNVGGQRGQRELGSGDVVAVGRAAASAPRSSNCRRRPHPGRRTWLLLVGALEGGWDLGGHANTNPELVSAARAQIAELGKNSPGTRRHPARRARREAIGLPRFRDPEDRRAVADSAQWREAPLGACHQQVPGA